MIKWLYRVYGTHHNTASTARNDKNPTREFRRINPGSILLKHPRRAGAPEGTADVDGTRTGYELRSRRVVWGMLYADDAYIISRSSQGLAKIMEVIVEVCRAFTLLAVSVKKTETMCMPPPRTPWTTVIVEAAGQIYKQV